MQAHNWTEIGKTGILENHKISDKLLKTALAKCVVLPFCQDYGIGLGKNQGEYVNLMHVKALPLPTSARLEEDERIPIDKLQFGNRVFRVAPYGRGVEYTELAEDLSKFKPSNTVQKRLMEQAEQVLDTEAANAFKNPQDVKICFTPTSLTGGTFTTDGTPGAVAPVGLTFHHCRRLSGYLRDTIHAKPWERNYYTGLGAYAVIASLQEDRNWVLPHLYLQKGSFWWEGEMGMTDRIRWVEVNRTQAFSNTSGTSTALGEAVVFGDEAVALIEVVTWHLRADENYQNDFGRTKAAAWYGIMAFGSVWDTANDGEAKIIRVASL
ncbi:MAG: hypothetical protein QME75_12455 [Deltaproteobacteria bacterium]|nr:hypothetical protein [Deltaproteobacteria bacterium]